MSFIIGVTLAILFLDWPWRAVVIAALAAIEAVEIVLWLKLRRMRSMTGAEGMVGAIGRAVSDCDPEGQVRVKGALWRAHADEGAEAGDDVVVTGVRGLELAVTQRRTHDHVTE